MFKATLIALTLIVLSSCTTSTTPSSSSGETTPTVKESKTIATPTYGSGKKNITIFADFQCPACINFSRGIGPILESYAGSGKLTIEYRQFPLAMHKNAKRDALAALCGAEQGKYMDYKKAIYDMEDRKAGASVSDTDRVDAATKAGLDGTKMAACLASDRYMGQVESDMAKGEGMRVDSTPTVFLDGKKLDMGAFRDLTTLTAFLDRVVAE